MNDNDFSMKVIVKKIITDDNIKTDSEIEKAINFILNSGEELNAYKKYEKDFEKLPKELFNDKLAIHNFNTDFSKKTNLEERIRHCKRIAKLLNKDKLNNSVSAEDSSKKIISCIKQIKDLKDKRNDYNKKKFTKEFAELKNQIKYEIINFKKAINNVNTL